MNEGSRIERFPSSDLEISRAPVLRLLGVRDPTRVVRDSILEHIDREREAALGIIDARAIVRSSSKGLEGSTFVDPSSPCAAAVCTIGSALEAYVADLLDRGERTRAVITDAVASAMAEALAEACDRRICRATRADGMHPGRRRSPGYGAWPLEEQRIIFAFLEPSSIGVTLTDRAMMVPRKSISFVVPLDDPGSQESSVSRRCSRCDLEGCPYRVEDGVE